MSDVTSAHNENEPIDGKYGASSSSSSVPKNEISSTNSYEVNALLMTEYDIYPFVLERMKDNIHYYIHSKTNNIRSRIQEMLSKEYERMRHTRGENSGTLSGDTKDALVEHVIREVSGSVSRDTVDPYALYKNLNMNSSKLDVVKMERTALQCSDIFHEWLRLKRKDVYDVKVTRNGVQKTYARVSSPLIAVMAHIAVTTMLNAPSLMKGVIVDEKIILTWLHQINMRYKNERFATNTSQWLDRFKFAPCTRDDNKRILRSEEDKIIYTKSIKEVPLKITRYFIPDLLHLRKTNLKDAKLPIEDNNVFSNVIQASSHPVPHYTFYSDLIEPNMLQFTSSAIAAIAFLISKWEYHRLPIERKAEA